MRYDTKSPDTGTLPDQRFADARSADERADADPAKDPEGAVDGEVVDAQWREEDLPPADAEAAADIPADEPTPADEAVLAGSAPADVDDDELDDQVDMDAEPEFDDLHAEEPERFGETDLPVDEASGTPDIPADAALGGYGGTAESHLAGTDEPVVSDEHGGELMPGAVEAAALGALWGDETAGDLRKRWQELQLRFIDDPRSAVDDAEGLVNEAVRSLTAGFEEQLRGLGDWRSGGGADTEELRVAVQQYRQFLDRLLSVS